jgi:hypothetical protein
MTCKQREKERAEEMLKGSYRVPSFGLLAHVVWGYREKG